MKIELYFKYGHKLVIKNVKTFSTKQNAGSDFVEWKLEFESVEVAQQFGFNLKELIAWRSIK